MNSYSFSKFDSLIKRTYKLTKSLDLIKMISWNGLVSIGLIKFLKDPELVIHFLKFLKPLRRDVIEEEAREWHISLRTNQQERWKRIAELSQKRKYHAMNASVPITCTLPFDGGMWRRSRTLLKSIRYFRKGFIKRPCWTTNMPEFELLHYHNGPPPPEEMENSEKISTVNLMFGDTERSKTFFSGGNPDVYEWRIEYIQDAFEDFRVIDDDEEAERSDDESSEEDEEDEEEQSLDKPYIFVEKIEIDGNESLIMNIKEN
tara:strand:- start:118 stop:897 length:780 start_codon:yes stop_codon:yes gene_type:complete